MSECLTPLHALQSTLAVLFAAHAFSDDDPPAAIREPSRCNPLEKLQECYERVTEASTESLQSFASEMGKYPWANLPFATIRALCSLWTQVARLPSSCWTAPVLAATLVEVLFSLQIPSPAPVLTAASKLQVVFSVLLSLEEILRLSSTHSARTAARHWSIFTSSLLRQLHLSHQVVPALLPCRLFLLHRAISLAMQTTPSSSSSPCDDDDDDDDTAAVLQTVALLQQWLQDLALWTRPSSSQQKRDWRLRIDTQALRYRALRHRPSSSSSSSLFFSPFSATARQQAEVVYWNELVFSTNADAREESFSFSPSSSFSSSSPSPSPAAATALREWCEELETHRHDLLSAAVAAVLQTFPRQAAVHLVARLARLLATCGAFLPGLSSPCPALSPKGGFSWETELRPLAAWMSVVVLFSRPAASPLALDLSALLLDAVRAQWLGGLSLISLHAGQHAQCVSWMMQVRTLAGLLAHASPLLLSTESVLSLLQGLVEAVLVDLHAHYTDILSSCTSSSSSSSLSVGQHWRAVCRTAALQCTVYVLLHRMDVLAAINDSPSEAERYVSLRSNVDLLLTDYWPICTQLCSVGIFLPLCIFVRPQLGLSLPLDDDAFCQRVHSWYDQMRREEGEEKEKKGGVGRTQRGTEWLSMPRLDAAWWLQGDSLSQAMSLRLLPWPCTLPATVYPNLHQLQEVDYKALLSTLHHHILAGRRQDKDSTSGGETAKNDISWSKRSLLDLPHELLTYIFSHLSYRRVGRLASVCKEVCVLVQGEEEGRLWRQVYLQTFPGHVFFDQLDGFCAKHTVSPEMKHAAQHLRECVGCVQGRHSHCPHCRRASVAGQTSTRTAATRRGHLSACWSGHADHRWRWLLQERVLLARQAARQYGQRFSTCPLIGCQAIITRSTRQSKSDRRERHLRRHVDQLLKSIESTRRREASTAAVLSK